MMLPETEYASTEGVTQDIWEYWKSSRVCNCQAVLETAAAFEIEHKD